jgi:formylglycine-generating enzyme required for sulfatase activity
VSNTKTRGVRALKRGSMKHRRLSVVVCHLALAAPLSLAAQGTPLTLVQIETLIRDQVNADQIMTVASRNCRAFAMDSNARARLTRAGANESLLRRLGEACERLPTPASPAPRPTVAEITEGLSRHQLTNDQQTSIAEGIGMLRTLGVTQISAQTTGYVSGILASGYEVTVWRWSYSRASCYGVRFGLPEPGRPYFGNNDTYFEICKSTSGAASSPRPGATPVEPKTMVDSVAAVVRRRDLLPQLFGADNFAPIAGGTFEMGFKHGEDAAEDGTSSLPPRVPRHPVTVSPYRLQKTEVTQEQWQTVMLLRPISHDSPRMPSHELTCPRCPISDVTWEEVQQFISTLNQAGVGQFRLPTESEWEFAVRTGLPQQLIPIPIPKFGDWDQNRDRAAIRTWESLTKRIEDAIVPYEWATPNMQGALKPQPVATKLPNKYGVYDMLGNVREWVADYCGPYPATAVTDPRGPSSASGTIARGRIIRGSDAGFSMYALRNYISMRKCWSEDDHAQETGFRLVRVQ